MHQEAVDLLEGSSGCPGKKEGWPEPDGGGGAGEQQLELGPGLEVEPTKLANILDAKGEGGMLLQMTLWVWA